RLAGDPALSCAPPPVPRVARRLRRRPLRPPPALAPARPPAAGEHVTAALPAAPLALPPLRFGAAQLGILYRITTDAEADGAVAAAWDAGIRYFDTAPHYGIGTSERRLGQRLRSEEHTSELQSRYDLVCRL